MNTSFAMGSDPWETNTAATKADTLFVPETGTVEDPCFLDLCRTIFAHDRHYILISEYQARGKRVFHIMKDPHDIEMLYTVNKIEGAFPVEHQTVTSVANRLRAEGHYVHKLRYETLGGAPVRKLQTPVLIHKYEKDGTDIFCGRGYVKGIAWRGRSTCVAELLRVPRLLNVYAAQNRNEEYAKLLRRTLRQGRSMRFFESDGYRFEEAPIAVRQTGD